MAVNTDPDPRPQAAQWLIDQAADADMWGRRDTTGSVARMLLCIDDGVVILDPISAGDWGLP